MTGAPGPPFPNASVAFAIAALAMLAVVAIAAGFGGGAAPYAFATAIGFGGLGTLVARYVPEPAPLRIGLTPFPLRAISPVLLLLPSALVLSELDNWIRIAFGAAQSESLGKPQQPALELVLLIVFLQPVVREFFFRGVLLQGTVSALGRVRGVGFIALVQALLFTEGDVTTPAGAVSGLVATFASAALLGLVRIGSGSLLPCIALSGGLAAIGVAAGVYPDRVAIPGFNAPGTTTPLVFLMPALASVALGVGLLVRQLAHEPALPPIPPPQPEDDEESGGLF
jgi:membrane protease YdiL (CAAX protease family)